MKKLLNFDFLLLLLFTFIGGFFRFYRLSDFPVSLNWDEVSHGYNAFSLLTTGRDEWGIAWPTIFRAFGDYKLPFYIYLSILPVALFGLNAFAVRFVSALAGTLAIPALYLLTNRLFPRSIGKPQVNAGLLTAFLLALTPWHFFLSRPALEANLALTLVIAGFAFLLSEKPWQFFLGGLFLALSLHTYNTARVFVPLLLLLFLVIHRFPWRKIHLATLSIFLFSLILVIWQVKTGEATARYGKIAILSESNIFLLGQKRLESSLPSWFSRLLYNRPVFFVQTITTNYLGFFTPDFYRQTAAPQAQFAIPGQFLISPLLLILALVGLVYCFRHLNSANCRLILAWFFIAPLAAALTDTPLQALRPNSLIPILILLGSLGFAQLVTRLSPKTTILTLVFLVLFLSFSFGRYLKNYFTDYAVTYAASWQYGYRQVVDYLRGYTSAYDKVFITKRYGEPHLFYAFYSKLSPEKLFPGSDNLRFKQSDWYWTDRLGQVYFVNDWNIPHQIPARSFRLESGADIPAKGGLLVTSPDHLPNNISLLKTINFPDGQPAFIIAAIP